MPQLLGLAPAPAQHSLDPVAAAGRRVLANSATASSHPGARSHQRITFQLMDRVTAAYQAFRWPLGRIPIDTDPTTLDSGDSNDAAGAGVASGSNYDWYFKADITRQQTYADVEEMDETSDEVSAALDTLADSAVNPEDGAQHTFVIEIDEGPNRDRAEAIFDQVTESCDLQRQAYVIARDMLKYGDVFAEVVVDETRHICRLKLLPAHSIWRNEDAAGNLMMGKPAYDADGRCLNKPGECAFDQREQRDGRMLAAFYSWQILHFRWGQRGTERYGRSMLRTARLVWKKLKAAEEALVVARLQRAWMRFVHYVDTTGMDRESARRALEEYRDAITRRFVLDTMSRESPYEVTSDFYVSSGYIPDRAGEKYIQRQAKIEVLQGDHGALSSIQDIEYFQNKMFASLRVPKAYLGIERDINARATLTTQDIQFARVLRRIQNILSQGYQTLFDFALVLEGIDPSTVSYSVRWPAILVSDEERDAIIRMYHARADATYWQMGAPSTRFLVQARFGLDDQAWASDLQDALHDPPMRLKPTAYQMPNASSVMQTNLDEPVDIDTMQANSQTMVDPADVLRDALSYSTTDDGTAGGGRNSDLINPPDRFRQSRASTQTEMQSAKKPTGSSKNPTAARQSRRRIGAFAESGAGAGAGMDPEVMVRLPELAVLRDVPQLAVEELGEWLAAFAEADVAGFDETAAAFEDIGIEDIAGLAGTIGLAADGGTGPGVTPAGWGPPVYRHWSHGLGSPLLGSDAAAAPAAPTPTRTRVLVPGVRKLAASERYGRVAVGMGDVRAAGGTSSIKGVHSGLLPHQNPYLPGAAYVSAEQMGRFTVSLLERKARAIGVAMHDGGDGGD